MDKLTKEPTSKLHLDQDPLIENENADSIRFKIPQYPNYPIFPSLLSVLSLFLLTGLGAYFYWLLRDHSLWITLPFLFTILGGGVGALLELGLLVTGSPFQMMKNKFTTSIQMIRFLNIAPIVGTIFFFVCSFAIKDEGIRNAILLLVGFSTFAMGAVLYYGPPNPAVPLIILGIQVAQLLIVAFSGLLGSPLYLVGIYLLAQGVSQGAAFVVGTKTPMRSVGFHVLSSLSGYLLYLAVQEAIKVDSAFVAGKTIDWSTHALLKWGVIIACIAGFFFAMKAVAPTYNVLRSKISNFIWSLIYFKLISAKRFPNPKNLSELYKDGPPAPSKLKPYYQQHPEFLPEALNIPAVERLEGNVTAFGHLVKKAKKAFKLIAMLDHFFPQANVNIPIEEKPRMKIWSDGSDIYPKIYTRKIFGKSLPITKFKKTPPPAIDAYKEGQLLAYLAESGIANTLLKEVENSDQLVIDFTYMEKYDTKPDYESYGGKAYFKVNDEKAKLELISVIAPKSAMVIKPNPMDPTFRHAESMIVASVYFKVISGKHLADIHMIYNLLEVVMHNAFDAKGKFNHPFRTFMYLHLFSHELAEELTTEHLVQEGAVFSQIFATTHDGLINHLNDQYHSFVYADDEDFENRQKIMRMKDGGILPKACIKWEMKYVEIWKKYVHKIVDTIYPNSDEEVKNDPYIQYMLKGMKEVFFNDLPGRYDNLQSKKGLKRWAVDTIHHLVIRHQVYGTSGIRAAMDPRISSTQIPKDQGTPGINEWRSLMGVGLATACSRFTLLYGKNEETFVYLLKGVDEKYYHGMKEAFEKLHDDLELLNKKWTANSVEEEHNYNYFRAIPSVLRTGAGY